MSLATSSPGRPDAEDAAGVLGSEVLGVEVVGQSPSPRRRAPGAVGPATSRSLRVEPDDAVRRTVHLRFCDHGRMPAPEVNRAMLRVRDAIDRDYALELDVDAMAGIAAVSPAHLIRTFQPGLRGDTASLPPAAPGGAGDVPAPKHGQERHRRVLRRRASAASARSAERSATSSASPPRSTADAGRCPRPTGASSWPGPDRAVSEKRPRAEVA